MTKSEKALLDKILELHKPGESAEELLAKIKEWAEDSLPIEDPPDDEIQDLEEHGCSTNCVGCSLCTFKSQYDNSDCQRFVCDMEDVGLEVEHYHGRSFWEGPAVRVDNIQDAVSRTKVKCQWDNMGLGYIVYPKQSGKKLKED